MPMSDNRWLERGLSEHPHEREALEFLRHGLADHDPWRAWARLQFRALDGSLNEIDLLVFGPTGFFLVELKAWNGVISGDQGTLTLGDSSRARQVDHPLRLLDLKCKRLKSLLESQKVLQRADERLPFLEGLLFLSHAEAIRLEGPAATAVFLRDPKSPGILEALRSRKGGGLRPTPLGTCNRPVGELIAKALEQAGVAPRSGPREVDGFLLGDTIEETTYYRDCIGRSSSGPRIERRVRIYSVPIGSQLTRDQVYEAADREAVVLNGLQHPGILRLHHWKRTDLGPALFFEHLPRAQRLDHFLKERGERLGAYQRLTLLNQIAEAVRYAHSKGIVHRALGPQNILVVDPDEENLRIQVTNWQTGARAPRDSGSLHSTFDALNSTTNPAAYVDSAAAVFAAPELRDDPTQRAPTLDVFSLGALCFRIFAGRAPADSQGQLFQILQQQRCLSLAAVLDGTLPSLEKLVRASTAVEPSRRLAAVDDFLLGLLEFEDELTRPVAAPITSPEDAVPGMELSGGLVLGRRLGMGSIAVAFEVKRGDDRYVLKWARKAEHNARIQGEVESLRKLDCDHIVRVVEEIEELGCRGFLMRPPSLYTLRKHLTDEGPLHLELLERFGTQLLQAVEHLQARGVAHRDIKPDNIGVSDAGRRQSLAVVLFDFSLSGTPATDLNAGTPRYLDPFLSERRRKQWDLAAERYALAVTLHEMATGALPRWGDGMTAATLTEGDVHVDSDLFPSEARSGLTKFFKRALARNPLERFTDATEMREGWTKAIGGKLETEHSREREDASLSRAEIEAIVRVAGVNTPVTALPLSTRAANCLGRLGIESVKGFLETPPRLLFMARGVGQRTRVEIDELQTILRELYPEVEIRPAPTRPAKSAAPTPEAPIPVAPASIEQLVERAFRVVGRLVERQKTSLRHFLALAEGQETQSELWPTQSAVAEAVGIPQPNLSLLLKRCREKWSIDFELRPIREHLATVLDTAGGALSLSEASSALLAHRSCDALEPKRSVLARALLRIATEAESGDDEPRWQLSRRGGQLLLCASPEHASFALALGAAADKLVQGPDVLGSTSVEQSLNTVPRPSSVAALPPGRISRLAAACSSRAALSARGELYPKGLAAERALKLSIDSVSALAERPKGSAPTDRLRLTEERLRTHLRTRYPDAQELPPRPDLDRLLRSVEFDVIWDESAQAYTLREAEALSVVSPSTLRTRIPARPQADGSRTREALQFEESVTHTLGQRGFRVLMIDPRDLVEARGQLVETFQDLRAISVDAALIQTMRAQAERMKVRWPVVLAADGRGEAERGNWDKLLRLVDAAVGALRTELLSSPAPLLITDLGLLARYGRLSLVDELRAAAGSAHPGTLILIPTDLQSSQPMLDGIAIPALPGQYERIPRTWLQPVETL